MSGYTIIDADTHVTETAGPLDQPRARQHARPGSADRDQR